MNTYYTGPRIRLIGKSLIFLLGILMALTTVLPALASDAYVTRGQFHTFADGITRGYDISGHARMTRTAEDKTLVSVHAAGLAPDTTYGAHVHNKACNDTNGGGHYQDIVGGPVNAVNEIWPGFTTNSDGIGNGNAINEFYARPEAQSVVIHDTDGKRIACADLD